MSVTVARTAAFVSVFIHVNLFCLCNNGKRYYELEKLLKE